MILGHKPAQGPTDDPYWFGKVDGHDRKFIRVIAGLAMPVLDRQPGAVIVLAELYRSFGAPDLWGLAAWTDSWGPTISDNASSIGLENMVQQYRKDLKFERLIVESEATRAMLWKTPILAYAAGEIPVLSYVAPEHASTEMGRQRVDGMIGEGRLHIDHLDFHDEQAAKAIQFAVCWMLEEKALYRQKRATGPLAMERPAGVEGL